METALLGVIYEDPPIDQWAGNDLNSDLPEHGLNWPAMAHTMIGCHRLRSLRKLVTVRLITETDLHLDRKKRSTLYRYLAIR